MGGFDSDGVDRIAELGAAIVPFQVVDGVHVAVLPHDAEQWELKVVDIDAQLAHPRRKRGAFVVRDVASFIAYINRHKSDAATVWADNAGGMTAYLNDHEPTPTIGTSEANAGAAGWRDHSVKLRREQTPGYAAWVKASGVELTQKQFAEFLEDRIGEITNPDGADLLEVATFFQAHTKIGITSARNLSNGEIQLHYTEEEDKSVGDTQIPTEFSILMRPYRDSSPVSEPGSAAAPDPDQFITSAKLRYRLHGPAVTFLFKLHEDFAAQIDGVHQAAIARVRAETDVPVLLAGAGG